MCYLHTITTLSATYVTINLLPNNSKVKKGKIISNPLKRVFSVGNLLGIKNAFFRVKRNLRQ
ncbi:hypothetical protein CaldiYA01_22780 [Caldicellulosiruptor diazotrophicus]|uniref:Uncharacterized protein n=1 Tax=Caldicellulosiruptor diazotrophicus TaxID=2806205 RepID=A0ABM7NQC5_9FIRM|nr:hypothetical protein CaldiYA01_22780 [Caldicellulosiruptor diazotrophicus]